MARFTHWPHDPPWTSRYLKETHYIGFESNMSMTGLYIIVAAGLPPLIILLTSISTFFIPSQTDFLILSNDTLTDNAVGLYRIGTTSAALLQAAVSAYWNTLRSYHMCDSSPPL
ncbi:hypothetical protein BC826DRAFT_1107625 [Russula brevipes]|nr:hypothetical protein BC826DRAFT_1107625 [Russula brevipes]